MAARTALVGYGMGGRVFHAPFVAAEPALELCAVVTGDPGRAQAVRAEHPAAEVVPDLDTLLARAEELGVELAIVSTPPVRHAEQATALLEAGLHVVVDKPLTVTAADGHALVALTDRVGRTLTPYQNRAGTVTSSPCAAWSRPASWARCAASSRASSGGRRPRPAPGRPGHPAPGWACSTTWART